MSIILVDLDGVLADFDARFKKTAKHSPRLAPYDISVRTEFNFESVFPAELHDEMRQIYMSPGFYRNLPLVTGAKEGVHKLLTRGHDVFICTAPLKAYKNCVAEKYAWVYEHLGERLGNSIIMTRDKTLIMGDILIDDNPDIRGKITPHWRHVVYAASYNEHVTDRQRFRWEQLEECDWF